MGKVYKLSRIKIEGIWHKYPAVNCDLKLNSNISIFVGKNGSGKTTVLKILKAFFSAQYNELISCPPFTAVELDFKSSPNSKPVFLKGKFGDNNFIYSYGKGEEYIVDEATNFSLRRNNIKQYLAGSSSANKSRRLKSAEEKQRVYEEFKNYLDNLVQFESITIDRDLDLEENERSDYRIGRGRRVDDRNTNVLDKTLGACISKIGEMHSRNISEINQITNDFFKQTFTKLLIPDEQKLRSIHLKAQLILGTGDKNTSDKNLGEDVILYNSVFSLTKERVAAALVIVKEFCSIHEAPSSAVKTAKKDQIDFHSSWCDVAGSYNTLVGQMEEFIRFKSASTSSRTQTIHRVEESTDKLINLIQKCDICYGRNKEYILKYWESAYSRLEALEHLYKPLFELRHHCRMLIETINAGVVSHNFDQETLSLKITNEIRENKETLRSLIQEANGSAGSQLSNKVDTHIRQIECLLNDNNDDLESYALTRLFIHERITEILQEYTKLKDRTLKIEERITALCELISEFIEPKYLSELDGSVSIYGGEDDREIDFTVLSTGEKQLLIILFKIFLSGNSLITLDEPELSLHISWQQKLLEAVNKLNPNAQLIVATHSPEIAAFNNAEVVSFER